MGSSKCWTEQERVALCEAWMQVSGDAAVGTDQRGVTFYSSVRKTWILRMRTLGAGNSFGGDRTVGSVTKTWNEIRKGASAFASHYLAVQRMQLTGNPTEEQLIVGALARHEGKNVYEAILANRGAASGAAIGKRKKNALLKWVPCWAVLRRSDKWSGAAGAAASGLPPGSAAESTDDDADSDDAVGGNSGCGSAFNRRPLGNKATKRNKLEERNMSKEVKASTAALEALAQASRERTAVAFFHLPEIRDTPEAALFLKGHALRMLKAVGLGGGSSLGPSTVTPAPSDTSAAGSRAAAGSAAGAPPVPQVFEIEGDDALDGGVVRAGTPPATPAAPPATGVAAPPDEGRQGVPRLSRGARAQMTKAAAAATALNASLGATIDLEGPAPSDEDNLDEEELDKEGEEQEEDQGDSAD